MEFLEKLNRRYATKIFDPTKIIAKGDLEKLLEAIRLSASSIGLQAYQVLVVENPEVRKKLRQASYNQSQITDASHLLVFAVDYDFNQKDADNFIQLIADTRNTTVDTLQGYATMIKGHLQQPAAQLEEWLTKQVYIGLGFGLVAAANLGIDSCPMEGFNTAEYDTILNLSQYGLKSKVILALGYRSEEDKYQYLTKVRKSTEDLFIHV
ncbi:MAG TPA: NAD(P)H-dependent oxidoreductase [Prolixibacteraceae bacterium]|jgi:nitroreductase|nr:NAD(P)H-dependent oxidoreductase [Prolixibacteraceae bacterium]